MISSWSLSSFASESSLSLDDMGFSPDTITELKKEETMEKMKALKNRRMTAGQLQPRNSEIVRGDELLGATDLRKKASRTMVLSNMLRAKIRQNPEFLWEIVNYCRGPDKGTTDLITKSEFLEVMPIVFQELRSSLEIEEVEEGAANPEAAQ